MADSDILKAIDIIDAKIASLQEASDRLASVFGVARRPSRSTPEPTTETAEEPDKGHPPKGRKLELAEFLDKHGPSSRTDITANAGLPDGTLSYCLNDKRFFEQREDGNWQITDFSRKGLAMRASDAEDDSQMEP